MNRKEIPNFIICGTQKGGTSALIRMLTQHPDTCVYSREINYFSWKYKNGWDWYINFFTENKVVGEKSPSYMSSSKAPSRIKKHLPNVKLIFLLRDPVERAYSHYHMNVRKGKEKRTFNEAIRKENIIDPSFIKSYKKRGLYDEQLARFRKFFPESQLLIMKSEELRHNTERTMNKVSKWLNLSLPFKFNTILENITETYPPIEERDKRILEKYYKYRRYEYDRVDR